MIKNSIKYVIEKLVKDSVYLTELAEKIQSALIEIGVDSKNCVLSIDVDYDGIETYLKVIPFHGLADKIHFEYSGGVLNTRRRYTDEYGFKLTTGYYDICHSEEDIILRIKNRVRRFMITHLPTNKKEIK